jgi:hypothetical protein
MVMVTEPGAGKVVIASKKLVLRAPVAAATVNVPDDEFATKAGAVAIPLALLTTCALAAPLKVPLAPPVPAFAVNVTVTPDRGAPDWLVTETASAAGAVLPAVMV